MEGFPRMLQSIQIMVRGTDFSTALSPHLFTVSLPQGGGCPVKRHVCVGKHCKSDAIIKRINKQTNTLRFPDCMSWVMIWCNRVTLTTDVTRCARGSPRASRLWTFNTADFRRFLWRFLSFSVCFCCMLIRYFKGDLCHLFNSFQEFWENSKTFPSDAVHSNKKKVCLLFVLIALAARLCSFCMGACANWFEKSAHLSFSNDVFWQL